MKQHQNEPLVTLQCGVTFAQLLEENPYSQETGVFQGEEALVDFGELNDYSEIFGEMVNF